MLRDIVINSGELYIGRKVGDKIHDAILSAEKSIKIVTPYISSEFVDLLIKRAKESVDISLIISDDFVGKDKIRYEIFKKLIVQIRHTNEIKQKRRRIGLALILFSYLVTALILIFGFKHTTPFYQYSALLFPLLILLHIYFQKMRIYNYTYKHLINFTVTMTPYSNPSGFDDDTYLTHAKIFIIDNNLAYVGSMNFTKAGFYYNYESRIKINDHLAVQSMSEEFSYLRENSNTSYLDLNELTKKIYTEPAN